MKKLFLVGNWKSHKTVQEAHTFMIAFLNSPFIEWLHTNAESKDKSKRIIICPPILLIPELARMLEHMDAKIPIDLGTQDISPFSVGTHTGEVAASEVVGLAKYVIVGHSERRKEFGETDELVSQKVRAARESGLEPILCVQGKDTPIPDDITFVAYEPIDAIGSGHPDDPAHAESVAEFLKEEKHIPFVLYGGSVTAENVASYTTQSHIDGVLVGGASLDPVSFSEIIQRA
jgi:triosephosphate isomerase